MTKSGWFNERRRHILASKGVKTGKKDGTNNGRRQNTKTDLTPLKGGLAEGKKPSRYNKKALEIGTEIEMEHTDDPEVARRIAMDHLEEHPDYYKYLPKMEKKLERKEKSIERKKEREARKLKKRKARK